jgi:hypothetical protein
MEDKKAARRKTAGIVLLVAGVAILALSLAADPLGIGVNPSFGYYQIIAIVVGAVAVVAGLILRFKK